MIIGMILCSCFTKKNVGINEKQYEFMKHLNLLDSAANEFNGDTVTCCSASIAYMVENTDVKISAEGTSYGFLYFTKSELRKWHNYYRKNVQ